MSSGMAGPGYTYIIKTLCLALNFLPTRPASASGRFVPWGGQRQQQHLDIYPICLGLLFPSNFSKSFVVNAIGLTWACAHLGTNFCDQEDGTPQS